MLFTPEDLKEMTPEQIDLKINEAFHHDDYKWNKIARIKYKSKGRIMTNMQDMLYKCPKCGKEMRMDAAHRYIRCLECGNGAIMDDYYDLHPFDDTCKVFETPTDWVDWERVNVMNFQNINQSKITLKHLSHVDMVLLSLIMMVSTLMVLRITNHGILTYHTVLSIPQLLKTTSHSLLSR